MSDDSLPAFPATVAPLAPGTAAVGTSLQFARQDHVHPAQSIPAAPVPATATPLVESGSGAVGASAKYAREDHVHPAQALPTVPTAATTTPLVESGSGAVGTGTTFARADHVHPAAPGLALSSTTPANLGTAAVGTGTTAARSDHVHQLPSGTPVLMGTISVGESALITLGLAVRRYTATITGLAVGDRLFAVLTGAPSNGSLQDVYVSAANTVNVGVLVPVLGVAATVAVPIAIYRVA